MDMRSQLFSLSEIRIARKNLFRPHHPFPPSTLLFPQRIPSFFPLVKERRSRLLDPRFRPRRVYRHRSDFCPLDIFFNYPAWRRNGIVTFLRFSPLCLIFSLTSKPKARFPPPSHFRVGPSQEISYSPLLLFPFFRGRPHFLNITALAFDWTWVTSPALRFLFLSFAFLGPSPPPLGFP